MHSVAAPPRLVRPGLGPAELLLGLLAEPECRAALLAAARGVDFDAARERWPELESASPALESAVAEGINRADELSIPVREALRLAELHRIDYPEPHMLATEHLLLGLATGDNEVAQWLATKGWDTAELGAEIDRLAGHDRGPLPIDFDSPTDGPPSATTAAPRPPRCKPRRSPRLSLMRLALKRRAREALRIAKRLPGYGFSTPLAIEPARRCA